ncbi:styrene monooxygenase/indole monooxygenase family protein [Capillimicrobium parvum]|uniref:Styrene monooxygenase StyA n=1 Tax=Capillimicrobium parvum TaxID=2884022 RepID=A0A9E6XX05_9ACTN|nr:styrene monooxygenase/indole monooxygenase family protein [Capillimicrobium parvum]UGS36032.1 Styrene monooxygenase StyA [Capillimicrobium parvum]
MSKIAIVGAGQAGLELALGLLQNGFEVTVVTNRTGEEIRTGRVLSSQCMFDRALQTERNLGLNLWDDECPPVEGIGLVVVGPEGSTVIDWAARLTAPAQSVDQRVKIPAWMDLLTQRGGELRHADAGVAELDDLARSHDLVVVASGKGEIGRLFGRDEERSPYGEPQRALALTYVEGYRDRDDFPAVTFNLIPGVGEYFWFPALTTTGPCHIMVFEGIPGGPMDCWGDVSTPDEHLARSLEILERHMPWEAERARGARLTDPNGILAGRLTPTVRHPVAELPSGAPILGMADVVVLNDPITGQGSNNAAKCAGHYLASIVDRRDGFDRAWMQATFDRYWQEARPVTEWTNMLLAPPAEHVVEVLGAAGAIPGLASRIVNGFDDASNLMPWWGDAEAAREVVAREAQPA